VGSFHLLLEAVRTRRDPKALLWRAGVELSGTPAAEEVVALVHALNATREGDTCHSPMPPMRVSRSDW